MLHAPSSLLDRVLDDLDRPTDIDELPTLMHAPQLCPTLGAGSHSDDDAPSLLDANPRSAVPLDPLIGAFVANHCITRRIGSGGGGVVYEAVHRHLGRRSAIKVLRDRLCGDPDSVSRFRSEAIAASRIGHPSVVSVFDYGYDPGGLAYLVMEYVDGESLEGILRGGRLELARAIDLAEQLASTMSAAHTAGVVHRDLKPSNVLVIRDSVGSDHIKVLDFGVAKFLAGGCDDRANTRMGTLLGTPLYMPPEQVRGQPGMDPRSDIYSLGCVMFEMVTGFVPFSGSACEIMSAHVERKPPRPSQFRHSICPELDALIVSMLAKNPDDRPASMELVSTRLRRISKLPRAWAMGGSSLPRADRSAARGTCGHRAVPTLVRPRRAGEACTSAPYAPHAPCPVWMRWAALGAVLCGALVLAACL